MLILGADLAGAAVAAAGRVIDPSTPVGSRVYASLTFRQEGAFRFGLAEMQAKVFELVRDRMDGYIIVGNAFAPSDNGRAVFCELKIVTTSNQPQGRTWGAILNSLARLTDGGFEVSSFAYRPPITLDTARYTSSANAPTGVTVERAAQDERENQSAAAVAAKVVDDVSGGLVALAWVAGIIFTAYTAGPTIRKVLGKLT